MVIMPLALTAMIELVLIDEASLVMPLSASLSVFSKEMYKEMVGKLRGLFFCKLHLPLHA
jgi:hypothetical protein